MSGYTYLWLDVKTRKYYVGAHWEGSWYQPAQYDADRNKKKRRPKDFRERVLKKFDRRRDLIAEHRRLLGMIRDDELGTKYYNQDRIVLVLKPNKARDGDVEYPDEEELRTEYTRSGGSVSSCEKKFGLPGWFVKECLEEAGIEKKDWEVVNAEANAIKNEKNIIPDELREFYSKHTFGETCAHFGIGQKRLDELFLQHNIQKRTLSEAVSHGWNKNFTIKTLEKFPYDPREVYAKNGYNLTATAKELGMTRHEIDLIFETFEIEKVHPQRSQAEIELEQFLREVDPEGEWEINKKDVFDKDLSGKELDIVSLKRGLAVEYCGLWWHSEFSSQRHSPDRKNNYHQKKMRACRDKGIELLTVFDSDDPVKVRKLLLKKLGVGDRVGARTLVLDTDVSASEAREFNEKHHIMGHNNAPVRIGLRNPSSKELMCLMTFGKPRFSKDYQWEMRRYTVGDTNITGGAQRLFSAFIETHDPSSVQTFSDLRFGQGAVYEKLGFQRLSDTPPNYWYHRYYTGPLLSRMGFQKSMLTTKLEKFDPGKTEIENMRNNKYDRIWDCGNAVYAWRRR